MLFCLFASPFHNECHNRPVWSGEFKLSCLTPAPKWCRSDDTRSSIRFYTFFVYFLSSPVFFFLSFFHKISFGICLAGTTHRNCFGSGLPDCFRINTDLKALFFLSLLLDVCGIFYARWFHLPFFSLSRSVNPRQNSRELLHSNIIIVLSFLMSLLWNSCLAFKDVLFLNF